MKEFNFIRCPLCGKLSREKNFEASPHKIEIKVQVIGGRENIRWYNADDPVIIEVIKYITKKLEILLRSLKNENPEWHISKNISMRVVPSTSYSMTTVRSSSQKSNAI